MAAEGGLEIFGKKRTETCINTKKGKKRRSNAGKLGLRKKNPLLREVHARRCNRLHYQGKYLVGKKKTRAAEDILQKKSRTTEGGSWIYKKRGVDA